MLNDEKAKIAGLVQSAFAPLRSKLVSTAQRGSFLGLKSHAELSNFPNGYDMKDSFIKYVETPTFLMFENFDTYDYF